MYGCIVPSPRRRLHLLLLTMFMKNDVHWFEWNRARRNTRWRSTRAKQRAVETLDYLNELHKFLARGRTYNWGELMSTYFTEKAATPTTWARGCSTRPSPTIPRSRTPRRPAAPEEVTDGYYLSIQGFHIREKSNVEGAKKYVTLLHEAPRLYRLVSRGAAAHHPGQPRDAALEAVPGQPGDPEADGRAEFLDSIWTKGVPLYYWDGKELNPLHRPLPRTRTWPAGCSPSATSRRVCRESWTRRRRRSARRWPASSAPPLMARRIGQAGADGA